MRLIDKIFDKVCLIFDLLDKETRLEKKEKKVKVEAKPIYYADDLEEIDDWEVYMEHLFEQGDL